MRRAMTVIACLGVTCAPASAAIIGPGQITQYATSVDLVGGAVTFLIRYDVLPDYTRKQSPQINFDGTAAHVPGAGQGQRLDVIPSMRTLACTARVFTCDVGLYSIHQPGVGIIGTVPFLWTGTELQIIAPLLLLNDSGDGLFTYGIEDVGPRGDVRRLLFGTSGQTYTPTSITVPEPAALLLFLLGAATAIRRRRH